MIYSKPPLTFSAQIKLLEDRGLIINDKIMAENYLSNISFYRLRAYTYPYQNLKDPNHTFKKGITFKKIIDDYIFDRKLKLIIFDAIEKIEISLRTQLIYHYSLAHGGNWYSNKLLFKNEDYHNQDLAQLENEITRSNENFITHFKAKYPSPQQPPAWMVFEIVSFGTLSKIFSNLEKNNEKKKVAEHFGLDIYIFQSWLHHITVVRNICAHHARLWNRDIPKIPKLPNRPKNTWIKENNELRPNKVYTTLCCLRYLLNIISPNNNLKNKIVDLINNHPDIDITKMGFQENWRNEYLWLL